MGVADIVTEGCVSIGDQRTDRWGDQQLEALYDAHVRDVYRYVHRMCLDHAVAEDVTQDVFIAAMRTPQADLTVGWLMRSARNRLIDIMRRDANHREKVRLLSRSRAAERDDIGHAVESLRLREAMSRLRREHRICLMLHYVDGCSVGELATSLGRSYKGAEGLLSRARTALRTELEGDR